MLPGMQLGVGFSTASLQPLLFARIVPSGCEKWPSWPCLTSESVTPPVSFQRLPTPRVSFPLSPSSSSQPHLPWVHLTMTPRCPLLGISTCKQHRGLLVGSTFRRKSELPVRDAWTVRMCWFDLPITFISRHKYMHGLVRRKLRRTILWVEMSGRHLAVRSLPALPSAGFCAPRLCCHEGHLGEHVSLGFPDGLQPSHSAAPVACG